MEQIGADITSDLRPKVELGSISSPLTWNPWIYVILSAFLTASILIYFRPVFVQNRNELSENEQGSVNQTKVLFFALLTGFIVYFSPHFMK